MASSKQSPGVVRFGVFEADLRAGELRKDGLKVRLQEQPFRVLALLLKQPGEVVTRDELREKLWSADTYVDFDKSLNTTVNKLREALGDSAENPRFVQTLHRRGYRFIAPVEGIFQERSAVDAAAPRVGGKAADYSALRRKLRVQQALLAVTAIALLAVSFVHFRQTPPEAPLRRFAFTPPEAVAAAPPLSKPLSLSHPTASTSPSSPEPRRESCGCRISISSSRGRSTVPKERANRSGRPAVISSGLQPVGNSRRSRFRAAWPSGFASWPAGV